MYQLQQQKKVIAAILVAVITLSIITVANNPEFVYKSPPVDTAQNQKEFEQKLADIRAEYQKFLELEQTDPAASREIMKTIITEEDVAAMVETALNTKQKITIPSLADSRIKIAETDSQDAVNAYFEKYFKEKKEFTDATLETSRNLYRPVSTGEDIDAALGKADEYVEGLYATAVPKSAAEYHKSSILIMDNYKKILEFAKAWTEGAAQETQWAGIYREWFVANTLSRNMEGELKNLNTKYSLVPIYAHAYGLTEPEAERSLFAELGLINEAEAFGLFGINFVIKIGDIVQEIKDAIASALSGFFAALLTSLIGKIEDSFKISNFMLYADALVAGQYGPDFFNKYVPDPAQQDLIKRFIPQFSCGGFDEARARQLADQKAKEYIGVDITKPLDTNAEDFYAIAARANHFMSGIDGQLIGAYAEAQNALEHIEKAINRELLDDDQKKAGRNDNGGPIQLTVGAIQDAQLAQFIGSIAMGTSNATVTIFISNIVKSVITTFLQNFLFRRAKFVYGEQTRQACIAGVTQVSQITPAGIPTPGPDVIDQGFIDRCRANPQQCAVDLGIGGGGGALPPPVPPPDLNAVGLQMSKTSYMVGEVASLRLSNTGAPEGSRIGWRDDLIADPFGTRVEPVIGQFIYEDQFIDANGNWPGPSYFPSDRQFTCADRGTWRKTAEVAGKTFTKEYTVVNNPANPCP